jgi:hypothetical protein
MAAIQLVNLGTYANDGTGDDLRTAFEKANANFTSLDINKIEYAVNVGDGIGLFLDKIGTNLRFKSLIAAPGESGDFNISISQTDHEVVLTVVDSINALVEDPAPMLGGNLDLNNYNIGGTGNISIAGLITSNGFFGPLTGNVTGNVTGNLTGDVTGDLTGDVIGNVTGNLSGNVTGNLTGNVTGNLSGNVTGNLSGNVTGDVTGELTGNVIGNLTGNVTGNVTGELTGNVNGQVSDITNHRLSSLSDVAYDELSAAPGWVLTWTGTVWTASEGGGIGGSGQTGAQGISIDFGLFGLPLGIAYDFGTFLNPNAVLAIDGNLSAGYILESLKFVGTTIEPLNPSAGVNFTYITNFLSDITVGSSISMPRLLIENNSISTKISNDNLVLETIGSGKVSLNGLLIPNVDGTTGQAIVTDGAGVLGWTDLFSGDYNDLTNKPDLSVYQLSSTAFSGNYNDLTNAPTLFSGNYNDLTNKPSLDSYQLVSEAFSGSYTDLTDTPDLSVYQLSSAAFSGNYNDLTNKPTLFSGSYTDLTDTPTLFSGDYNDLTNKPTFDGSYDSLTNKPVLFSGSYNDLTDTPTLPQTINDLGVPQGMFGTFLLANGDGTYTFADPNFFITTGTGDVTGPASSLDNGIVVFDSTTGKLIKGTNVTITPTGELIGISTGNILPFFFETQANFPSASVYPGAIAYSEADGEIFFAHNNTWNSITTGSSPSSLLDLGITDGSNGQVLTTNGSGAFSFTTINVPDSLLDLGITDGSNGQVLTTNGSGTFTWTTISTNSLGNISVTNSTLNTTDPVITFTPSVNFSDDINVTGNVDSDTVTATTVTADNFVSSSIGTPTLESATNIELKAAGTVILSQGPIRMAIFTTAERDALLSQNGDMIYNSTTNKFQGYANGAWVDLH